MSQQGSVSVAQYGFERQLLDCWGIWARQGGAETGISRVDLLKKCGVGLLFGDEWMLSTDSTIAGLAIEHKRTLKKIYLSRSGLRIKQARKEAAIAAFAYAFECVDTSHLIP